MLTAGGSTLTVSPGNADAVSAVAEAHASPGHAETIAAAARAVADCEDGALAEGAAALAVAHPDEGAATETWLTATEAKNNNDNDSPIRKVVENKCHQEKEEKKAPPKEEAPAPRRGSGACAEALRLQNCRPPELAWRERQDSPRSSRPPLLLPRSARWPCAVGARPVFSLC